MKLILTHDDGEVIDSLEGITGPEFDETRRNALAAAFLLGQLSIGEDDKMKSEVDAAKKKIMEIPGLTDLTLTPE